jgi:Domain of unknown function (DUF4926)/Domain of unknown function (DUF6883)
VFVEPLREHAQRHEISVVRQTRWGQRYEIDGELKAPDGRQPRIRTVWQVDEGQIAPRLDNGLSFGGRAMIKEHDIVVLTEEVPEEGLTAGDVGTVVHIHNNGEGYEVEFMTLTGQTIAVASLSAQQVRPVSTKDISHVRELQPAFFASLKSAGQVSAPKAKKNR